MIVQHCRSMAFRDDLGRMDGIIAAGSAPLEYGVTRKLIEARDAPVAFDDLSGMRAVGNVYATREGVARALGVNRDGITKLILDAMSRPEPPELVDEAPFQHGSREDFDLTKLPIPKYFPQDDGRYITSAVATSEFEGKRNMSFHRMRLRDERSFAVRLVPRHLYTMWKASISKGRDLPVAFSMGLPASVLLSAALSTEYATDEMDIASALERKASGRALKIFRLRSGVVVPASAEIVMEGRMTSKMEDEGPFMDITGTYDSVRPAPVFEVDRLHMRQDPIFHLLLPGGGEHFMLMGLPREPMIYRTVSQVVPRTHAVRLTEGGCCWLHGVVSISKNKEGDGINAAMAAFSGHPSMKKVTVVDEDVDIFDDRDVEWAEATRFQASRSLMVVNNAAGSSLDPSAHGTTSKMAIDATRPFGAKGFERARLE